MRQLTQICFRCYKNYISFAKKYSTDSKQVAKISKLRNIGILAHIDAGKTTTTERMLYYSGVIGTMGEVHHGNTVTDWMDQERRRGITITSAAVSFQWNEHQFNLIDTPGHIDFTMEVEQTLNVLDGGVVVLDASAGVEAQTLTVWRQADRYKIPRIILVNKMDRQDADLTMCCKSIKQKLDIPPLCLQLPIKEDDGKLTGIIDILSLEKLIWNQSNRGKTYTRTRLNKSDDSKLYEDIYLKRMELVDALTEHDDALADAVIQSGSLEKVSTTLLTQSIHNATLNQKIVPVLCGSSYKNIGVQPLMDAVILYLPSPIERNKQFKCFNNNLCAKAFKIIHHEQRGPLVFFRLYSGQLTKGQKIYNIQQERSEQIGKLLMAYADEFKEVNEIDSGNIAVVTGLKQTVTGDLITSSNSAANNAKKSLEKYLKKSEKEENNLIEDLFGVGRRVPEPVFFCSIEPPSLAYASALEQALLELSREDPSLRVINNTETGQTILAGMGELHIEIIKERIKTEYKIDVDLGPLQIAYKETPQQTVKDTYTVEHKIGKTKHRVVVTFSVVPKTSTDLNTETERLILDKSQESASNLSNIFPKHLLAVKMGVDSALAHGPKLGCPVVGANIILHWLEIGRGTSETIISAAVTQCLQKLLMKSQIRILEPIMFLEVVCTSDYVSTIIADLSRRRATIQQVTTRGNNRVIHSYTPLSDLLGYAKDLRTITSGSATYSMQFHENQPMNSADEAQAIRSITGI
ncbi:ribosome-releasing factor 2, mitochondrial [Chrysoperla carnea]|uniref:ribosome-releasing factor 2, mitochondrial n=1 Tax=Chrysoperla carnea TaxID=189513 RepID=UPI001D07A3D0|nr:ribosome-releasing factor 2, mitochondrial [Chrysoperla carnea]